jgi:transglutaminase-like putative cysteine protease
VPHIEVVHSTGYRYKRPVRFTPHRAMLRPRDSHDLRLNNATLGLTPPAEAIRWAHDVFGNSVCYLDWGDVESDSLDLVSTLEIDHFPSGRAVPNEILDPVAETFPFSYAQEELPDLARLIERQHVDPEHTVDAWVRSFLHNGAPTRTMELLSAITQAVKADFTYEAREQEGTNPPAVTLASRRGACRDFALLMMEAVRVVGIAARFVSGYLYDDTAAAATVGGGATHAWVAVYLPGAGWVEYDPTNGLIAGRNLIRVCTARTPEQAVPISGGFIGGEDDFDGLQVDVKVTVGEVPRAEAADLAQPGSSSSASPTAIRPPSITSA